MDMLSIILHDTRIHHSNVCDIDRNSCIMLFSLNYTCNAIIFALLLISLKYYTNSYIFMGYILQ